MLKSIVIFLTAFCFVFAEDIDLSVYENSLYSDHGEDGVLSKLFQLIKPSSRTCVELGAFDGFAHSNTYLLRLQGWDCSLFDRQYQDPDYNLHKEFITAENINDLFKKHQVSLNFDLLCINIEYNGFHVWNAINAKYKPAVVVIACNASHLPHEDKVVQYQPYFYGKDGNYYGASILALYNLGRSKGYSLVYAEKSGMSLFFIRDELLQEKDLKFIDMNNVEKLYRSPSGGNPNNSRPEDPKDRAYLSSLDVLKS